MPVKIIWRHKRTAESRETIVGGSSGKVKIVPDKKWEIAGVVIDNGEVELSPEFEQPAIDRKPNRRTEGLNAEGIQG